MRSGVHKDVSRDAILEGLKRYAAGRREEVVRLMEFCAWFRITDATLRRHWGSWKALREAAGMQHARARVPVQFSDAQLIGEYRRICRELGRSPTPAEFDARACCRMQTLRLRFGKLSDIRRRAAILDKYRETFGREFVMSAKPKMAWDVTWLAEEWKRVRIGFALYCSDIKERYPPTEPFPCDVVFCAEDDWPACPAKVIVAREVLKEPRPQPPWWSRRARMEMRGSGEGI